MLVSDFDYELPPELIAQEPAPRRDASRLLVVNRTDNSLTDTSFDNLTEYMRAGDVLVLNNSRVFPARLIGRIVGKGGDKSPVQPRKIELFLVRRIAGLVWEALAKPGRIARVGTQIAVAADNDPYVEEATLIGEIVKWLPNGRRIVEFKPTVADFDSLVDRLGMTPLPPYIKRADRRRIDAERYQTVYAKERGSIAAPTAGLHFTQELLDTLRSSGVQVVEITHHVGYGTFQPVRAERVDQHQIESETYSVGQETARCLTEALACGRRVIAVGTTTTRALESAAISTDAEPAPHQPVPTAGQSQGSGAFATKARVRAGYSNTELFIYPGYRFRVLGGLITNFHLPRSSLLMLVSAFAGQDLIVKAYRHAVEARYRFYSYGDAMLIL